MLKHLTGNPPAYHAFAEIVAHERKQGFEVWMCLTHENIAENAKNSLLREQALISDGVGYWVNELDKPYHVIQVDDGYPLHIKASGIHGPIMKEPAPVDYKSFSG